MLISGDSRSQKKSTVQVTQFICSKYHWYLPKTITQAHAVQPLWAHEYRSVNTWAVKLTTKICKGIDYLYIASTNLDCGARWYSYIGDLNLGLCPVDGESQRLCFFIHYLQGQDEHWLAIRRCKILPKVQVSAKGATTLQTDDRRTAHAKSQK